MDYLALKSEIEVDPAAMGYCVEGVRKSNSELLSLLNTPDARWTQRAPNGKTPLYKVLGYLGATGILARLKRLEQADFPEALAGAPQATKDMLQSAAIAANAIFFLSGIENLDLDDTQAMSIYNGFVSAGVITAQEAQGLLNVGNLPTSRAIHLFGFPVTADDLERSY